ncbi:tetraspanin-16 [Leptonychotes weddellii]|uniref:Tetraspanin-16 n=1 Tax=Leptonychotes weddellii TaxID=9713 RepID=A0A7F8RR78_LEPWE|nr:tetraspanin-16 [Leptonychotes weddellii]
MDEMHTPYSSLKRLLSFFNGFVAMCGVIPIGLSIYVKFRGAVLIRVLGLASAYLLYIGYLCLAMGCISVLLSFAGWYGATKESRGTLLFCFLSTVIILIAEIIVTTVVLALFHIVKNYTDFSGYCYPRSGCKSIGTAACDGRDVSTDIIHQGGCFPKLLKITKTQSFNLSGGLLGAAVIQLPGILATLLLFIKGDRRSWGEDRTSGPPGCWRFCLIISLWPSLLLEERLYTEISKNVYICVSPKAIITPD